MLTYSVGILTWISNNARTVPLIKGEVGYHITNRQYRKVPQVRPPNVDDKELCCIMYHFIKTNSLTRPHFYRTFIGPASGTTV